jgi:hypothetical protein
VKVGMLDLTNQVRILSQMIQQDHQQRMSESQGQTQRAHEAGLMAVEQAQAADQQGPAWQPATVGAEMDPTAVAPVDPTAYPGAE